MNDLLYNISQSGENHENTGRNSTLTAEYQSGDYKAYDYKSGDCKTDDYNADDYKTDDCNADGRERGDCKKDDSGRTDDCRLSGDEFIYYVEEGENIVDIAAKFKVPCETLIKENYLSSEPPIGYALIISSAGGGKILLPEDLDFSNSTDPFSGVYPFKIVKK